MKPRIIISTFFVFIGILCYSILFAQNKNEIFPINDTDTIELLIGKNISYFALNSTDKINLKLNENTEKLAIFSRTVLEDENDIKSYSFSYKIDNGKLNIIKIKNAKYSKNAIVIKSSENKIISTIRKTLINIPKGSSIITIENNEILTYFHFRMEKTGSKKWEDTLPTDSTQNKIHILVGKPFNYYQLSEKKPTILNVTGPGKLFIYSRLRLPIVKNKNLPIGLIIKLDDDIVLFKNLKNKKATTNAVYLDFDNIPSNVNKFLITVPPEKHQIKIYSKNTVSNIDAHFKYLQENPISWVDLPIQVNDTVILRTNSTSKQRRYYRVENNKPVTFNVIGPLRLRILVRGEFQYFMHGENEFKFQILENNKVKNTYKFTAQRSKKLEYKYNKELIPGTLKKFYIDVPKGNHTYKFELPTNYNKTLLFRFSIDKKE